jgi:hypothetical protein
MNEMSNGRLSECSHSRTWRCLIPAGRVTIGGIDANYLHDMDK